MRQDREPSRLQRRLSRVFRRREPPSELLESPSGKYALRPATKTLRPEGGLFRFAIVAPDGALVRDFSRSQERDVRLIVVSRDLCDYAHLLPDRDVLGNFSVELPAMEPGHHRAFAVFTLADGRELALSADVTVTGRVRERSRPQPSRFSHVGDLEVGLAGTLLVAEPARITFRVVRGGCPVLIGEHAHVVLFRWTDATLVHAQRVPQGRGDGELCFEVRAPSTGRYRVFLEFETDGVPRTAAFTLDAA